MQVPVSFSNSGLAAAAAVVYRVELSGNPAAAQVSYNGVPCSYDPATGVVSGCGLPASLVPGQAVNLVTSYTAPQTGPVQVTSSISTTTVLPDGLGSTGRNFTTLSNRLSSAASRLRAWVQSQPSQPSAATASSVAMPQRSVRRSP